MEIRNFVIGAAVVAGFLTGLAAWLTMRGSVEALLSSDLHAAKTLNWTILSLPGVGLLIGTVVGNIGAVLLGRMQKNANEGLADGAEGEKEATLVQKKNPYVSPASTSRKHSDGG